MTAPRARGRRAVRIVAPALAALTGALLAAGCGAGSTTSRPDTLRPAAERRADPAAASAASAGLGRVFSADSPWNTPATGLSRDPRSEEMLRRSATRLEVVEQADGAGVRLERRQVSAGVFINTDRWTTPIVSSAAGTATRVFCRQAACPDAQGNDSLSIPAGVDPDPRYDGWFTVLDPATATAYDMWRARRQADGSVSFQYLKRWSIDGRGFGQPGEVSARGSGLPLFAGVITAQDLQSGVIQHALAISLPGPAPGRYVQPASATDGNGPNGAVPEGARLVLKPGVSLPRLPAGANPRLAGVIARALTVYGAIVVDRAAVPTLYAQRDVTGSLLKGNELQGLHLSDFEVVQLGRVHRHPPAPPASTAAEKP